MGRRYSISYTGTLTTAGGNADLLEIIAAANKSVRLLGFSLGQTSELGDAAEENLRITVNRLPATFTSGSGGSTPTPRSPNSTQTSAGFVAECNNATVATTTGTLAVLAEFGWNIRSSPYEFWYPDIELCPDIKNGEGLVIRCESTPADDITINMTFWVEEMG